MEQKWSIRYHDNVILGLPPCNATKNKQPSELGYYATYCNYFVCTLFTTFCLPIIWVTSCAQNRVDNRHLYSNYNYTEKLSIHGHLLPSPRTTASLWVLTIDMVYTDETSMHQILRVLHKGFCPRVGTCPHKRASAYGKLYCVYLNLCELIIFLEVRHKIQRSKGETLMVKISNLSFLGWDLKWRRNTYGRAG